MFRDICSYLNVYRGVLSPHQESMHTERIRISGGYTYLSDIKYIVD